jgi:hypothetical protein
MPLDPFVAETVGSMVRYIDDDDRIARHVGCSVSQVRSMRRRNSLTREERTITRSNKGARNEDLDAARDRWTRDARRGTDLLAEALLRAGEADAN